MFEHRKELMQHLINTDDHFAALYARHEDLDHRITEDAEGRVRIDDLELHRLKKERLLSKDRMAFLMDKAGQEKAAI